MGGVPADFPGISFLSQAPFQTKRAVSAAPMRPAILVAPDLIE